MPRVTDKTLVTPKALKDDLEQVRVRGYAVDDEEHALGLRCVASAVFDEHGSPVAGLSVSGPTARLPEHRLSLVGAMVAAAAQAATAEIGDPSAAQSQLRGDGSRLNPVGNN